MARQRMIKPDFFSSESLGMCRVSARLAFVGLWVQADDKGHLKCQFGKLRRQVFPYDDMDDAMFAELLAELERVRCIFAYEVDGERYLCVKNFGAYQTIQRPSKTTIPDPPEGLSSSRLIPAWIAELWPPVAVENAVEKRTLNECSMSAHPKERRKEGRRIYLEDSSSSDRTEDGAVENSTPCPPSIAQRFREMFA